jgi:hypothetical protein
VLVGVDALTVVVVDVGGVSGMVEVPAGANVLSTDPPPHAARVSIAIAAIGMAWGRRGLCGFGREGGLRVIWLALLLIDVSYG